MRKVFGVSAKPRLTLEQVQAIAAKLSAEMQDAEFLAQIEANVANLPAEQKQLVRWRGDEQAARCDSDAPLHIRQSRKYRTTYLCPLWRSTDSKEMAALLNSKSSSLKRWEILRCVPVDLTSHHFKF